MTAPRTCERCGAALDAGETCTCGQEEEAERTESRPEAGTMEFVMGDSLKGLPKTIDFNFEQLKGQLQRSLEMYSGLVVTEDGIKAAKEDRARLNKLRDALETRRKQVKKECMAPYTDFEGKVKELVGLIDRPIAAIDGQLKEFERQRREARRADVLAIYEETIGELRELLPFEKLWRDEWTNAGMSMKKIREALTAAEEKTRADLEVLSAVDSEFAEAARLKYLERLDLSEALAEHARLKERAEKLREYEAQRQAAQAAAEPAAAVTDYQAPGQSSGGSVPEEETDLWERIGVAAVKETERLERIGAAAVKETVYRLAFECQVTKAQAAELSAWLKARNISYRRI